MSKKKYAIVLFSMLLLCFVLFSQFFIAAPTVEKTDPGGKEGSQQPSDIGNPNENMKELHVTVQMDPLDFTVLNQMNMEYMERNNVKVYLENIPPESAYTEMKRAARIGDAADVMLLDSEWIREFAVSGYILPVDSYFSSVASNEALDVVMNMVKWNGYIWAVPKDVDPYVFVWNESLLRELGANRLPADREAWLDLLHRLDEAADRSYLLALQPEDPYSFVSLLRRLGPTGDAIPLLEAIQPYLYISIQDDRGAWELMKEGKLLGFVSTWSQAMKQKVRGIQIEPASPERAGGELWIASRSFAVFAGSKQEEEAKRWILEMTSPETQREWLEKTDGLPAIKAEYAGLNPQMYPAALRERMISAADQGIAASPELAEQMAALSKLVRQFVQKKTPAALIAEHLLAAGEGRKASDDPEREQSEPPQTIGELSPSS
ncbi:ABC transporter substrate-binding protein [Paenibacillus sp. CECT 9249]|uniref:ABC transporter substrate-binding protein n=1 Tax=unclassified Paenibacillus TaxID=185978 RepID=UPI001C124083|nr:extracellular solute-binding protein [Paenibacillus sp. CECT 9249]MBU5440495.1 extracellular solute-binding protein [Paenibacillus sp. MSJ-34]CAH0119582.1 hypothetical protein PAE9249_02086 [Paenibacillus sp. CECT 9249]